MSNIIKNVYRCDEMLEDIYQIDDGIEFVKGSATRTDEGYIKGVAPVAKIGILRYRLPNGDIRRELVNADTLFNSDSMKTLEMKPFTNLHPKEVLLDNRTVKRRKIGATGETVKQDGEHLMVSYVIMDKDAVDSIDLGRKQLSPGYRCDLLLESGNLDGEDYDAIQKRRRYNHVALCDNARGGSSLQINIDHCDGFESDENFTYNSLTTKKEKIMPKINIDGIDYEASQEVINSHKKLATKVTSLQGKIDAHTDGVSSVTAERDNLQTKVDGYEKEMPGKIRDGIKNRIRLERLAEVVLDSKDLDKLDSLENIDLKKKIIVASYPDSTIKLDDRDEAYLDVRIDGVLDGLTEKKKEAVNSQRQISAKKFDENKRDEKDETKSRNDMIDDLENGYKTDLDDLYSKKKK